MVIPRLAASIFSIFFVSGRIGAFTGFSNFFPPICSPAHTLRYFAIVRLPKST